MRRILLVSALLAAGCGRGLDGTCEETLTCPGGDGGADVAADVGVDAPVGCDLTKDPKDSPLCIADGVGIFVDAAKGDDTGGNGSMAKPVKSVGKALSIVGGKPRIYVCDGTYAGSVDVAAAVAIYGGLTCAWAPGGARPILQADKSAYGVSITASNATLVDLEVDGKDAAVDGESSIALVTNAAQSVALKRVKLVAGTGKDGKAGALGSNYAAVAQSDASIKGKDASGVSGGSIHVCSLCTDAKNSVGGAGGSGGAAPSDGSDGTPNLGGLAPIDGKGGAKDTGASCANAHKGALGVAGVSAPQPVALGAVASTWTPANGAGGTNGGPGQGGGGGGGGIDGSNVSGGGGGGGCGGCGGAAGNGGMGGGASIGLLLLASSVSLVACEITTKQAGNGGNGGAAQAGQLGGYTGNQSNPGCLGGTGGNGGLGGTGAGGAGGVSAPILFKGTPPNVDTDTQGKLTPGAKGNKGTGGTPGTNDGVDGLSQPTFECKAPQCN